ncbi:MAG: hypothetical protein C4529_00115 [Deltaproteobacteria bacterium]|nr:MAG: hypothetical protein C4529_00115 [Deltaproteobacteria bacterium]
MDELELMEKNPARKLKMYPVDKKLKYIPPDAHLALVEIHATGHQRRLIIFMRETGARISEAMRAGNNNIDKDRKLVTLYTRKKRPTSPPGGSTQLKPSWVLKRTTI